MIIYPAMDLMGGRAVRLRQGRFDDASTYEPLPADALRKFAEAGADWGHVVDLDGARAGAPAQHELISKLAASTPLHLQVGGGFRTREQVKEMLDAGVARVVIGSLAVQDPGLVGKWLDEFGPERITLAVDVRMSEGKPIVAVSGWAESSGMTLWQVADLYPAARHLLLTDVGRDGMLAGPNFSLLDAAVERFPGLKVQASGGISSLDDLRGLRTDGAIVGKSLWEGRFSLQEALSLACA